MTGRKTTAISRSDMAYRDLLADVRHPGCPVCRGADRSAWRLIDAILWEFVNDPTTRLKLRASHGFCREHMQMAARVASSQAAGLGIAILLEDFLFHVTQDAMGVVERPRSERRRDHEPVLSPHTGCTACASADLVARRYLQILAASLPDDEVGTAIREPQHGLCAPHLAQGFRLFPGRDDRRRLLEPYLLADQELRGELARFIRHHDYQHQDEPQTDGERSAWPRAVARLVGEPSPTRPPER